MRPLRLLLPAALVFGLAGFTISSTLRPKATFTPVSTMPPIDSSDAYTIKKRYADDRVLLGKYMKSEYDVTVDSVFISFDANGDVDSIHIFENRALHSLWIPSADIDSIYASDPNVAGIRVYPGMDTSGVRVIDRKKKKHWYSYAYHTLVIQGTVEQGGEQQNLPQAFQYISPCPDVCSGTGSRFYP